jgi:TolA-binding protein
MTIMQPCPDSLLARARAGTLSSAERSQLHRHLGQCETCRVTLLVGQDFDGALAAQSDDTLLATRVVDAVRASVARGSVSPATRGASRRGRLLVYGVAAALLTISSIVGAARPELRRTLAVLLGLQDREVRRDVAQADATPHTDSRRVVPPETSIVAQVASATPAPAEEHTASPRYAGRFRAETFQTRGGSPKDLFAEANAKRRVGDEAGAMELYQELQQRYPHSTEAEVSRVALGRLLLERSQDPKAALYQFDRALTPPGQSDEVGLAEEALVGRATALMRLGRTVDERKTWLQLLERFPASIYADRARARLDETSLAPPKRRDALEAPAPK